MADHKRFSIMVYFCDPQSPWLCGSNEKTNGLSIQCIPTIIQTTRGSRSKNPTRLQDN